MNKSKWEQRWLRFEHERKLRNPTHLTGGLDLDYWEAWPEYPILTPRRQDFETYDDYVHACWDFVMEMHRLQMKADRARKKDHPKVRDYMDVLFRENRLESMMKIGGALAAAYYGRPDIGFSMGLGGGLGQRF